MYVRLLLVLFLFSQSATTFSQARALFVSDDNTFRVFLPGEWEQEKNLPPNTAFSVKSLVALNKSYPPTMKLETATLSTGFENADIKELATAELEITRKQYGDLVTIEKSDFRTINNKLWWDSKISIKISSKQTVSFHILKTVHNKLTYTLSYSSDNSDYELFSAFTTMNMNSFMFYTHDETVYKNASSMLTGNILKAKLKNFEGSYSQQVTSNTNYTILIGNLPNGTYGAMEMISSEIQGKTFQFQTMLAIDKISNTTIELSSDAVLAADIPIEWTKTKYQLSQTEKGLEGISLAIEKSFPMALLKKDQPAQVNTANTEAPSVNENSPTAKSTEVTNAIKEYGSSNPETGEIDEASFIRQYGANNVKRKSKTELLLNTSSGKTVSLKDVGGDEDESKVRNQFLGSVNELNSYLVYQLGWENANYLLVNKVNGSMAYFPEMEYFISPGKKWIAVYRSDIISLMDESYLKIFSLSATGIKEVFKKLTLDMNTNKGWGVKGVKWLDDTKLEVEKEVVANAATEETKSAGKILVNLENGSWKITNQAQAIKR